MAVADEEVCREATNFTNIFYDAMDRKRDKINYLYCEDKPSLVWNGNPIDGVDNILRFISALPETVHDLVSVDAQRLPDSLSDLPGCVTVTTAGSVTLGGTIHSFTQAFTLVVEDGKYKVKSDRFRYVD